MPPCKYCGAQIIYATTSAGGRMPFDAEPVKAWRIVGPDHAQADARAERIDTFVSHFATCPNTDKHRRRR